MTERGFFTVDRGFFDHPVFADDPYTEREAWLWLISEAAFKNHRKRVGRAVCELRRGQVAHTLRFMAKSWKWSDRSVRRFLEKLSANQMIVALDAAQVTQITICNYDAYQLDPEKRAADAPQMRRRLEEKEEGKEEAAALLHARARELAFQVYDIFGFDREFIPPNWMGLSYWLEAGMSSAGWKPDLVRLAASRVAARSKSRGQIIKKYTFLEGPINDAHNEAAPVVPPAATVHPIRESVDASDRRQRELILPINGGNASTSGSKVVDAGLRRVAEFRALAGRQNRTGGEGNG